MAGAPPALPVPAVAVPAVAFALAPALAGGAAPIDYTTQAGQAMYSQATEKLPYLFRGKESSLPTFLQALRNRADAAGWEDIFTITIGADGAGNAINRNLLTQYGEITLTHVRDNAAADYIGQQVRNAQISQPPDLSVHSQVYYRRSVGTPSHRKREFLRARSSGWTIISDDSYQYLLRQNQRDPDHTPSQDRRSTYSDCGT